MTNRIVRTIFLITFFIPSFVAGWITLRPLQRGFSSTDWPSVQGKVLSSEIKTGSPLSRFARQQTYRETVYEYEVAGQHYTSRRIGFARFLEEKDFERNLHPGDPVCVYYDPERPEIAVLRTLKREDLVAGFLLPSFFLLFCLVCLVLIIRIWWQKTSA